jgi:cobalt-zinc-cadmium efflux system outer membrane protein
MYRINLFAFILVFFITNPSPGFSEGMISEALSLEEALRIAYTANPSMKEAREEVSGSKGRRIQAEALPDPELEMDIGGFKGGNKEVDSIAVVQPLDPLGTRFLRSRIAHDEVNISKNALDLIWGQVSAKIIATYYQILAFEKALDVAEENLGTTRQFLTQVDTRFQSGSALKGEVLRARIEASRAENEYLTAEKDLKISRGEMNLLLGRAADASLLLKDALNYEPLRLAYQGLIEKALIERPDVKIEKIRLSAKKKSFWSALLKTVFPQMSIGLERSTEDYDNDTALLLKASYPLWGFNLGEVKEAKAEKKKQEVRLEAFKRQVGLDVYKAFLEAELADKQVVLQKRALDEANELLRQVTLQYEEGELLFLSYLENIKTIKETRVAYYTTLKSYQEKVALLERAIQKAPAPEGEHQ